MNTLELAHPLGKVNYEVMSAGFHLDEGGRLHLAIEAEADDEEFPPELMLALVDGLMVDSKVEIKDIHQSWDGPDGKPHAFVYTTFHARKVDLTIAIEDLQAERMDIYLQVVTDDIRSNSGDSILRGRCRLERVPKSDLWSP